jgi:hypothetical protein
MRKQGLLAACLVLGLTVAGYAQSVAGKWTGEQQGRGGAQPVTLDVKVDGTKLTGTMMTGETSVPIQEGMVMDGGKLMFKTTQNRNGNDVTVSFTGEMKGDELTLTREGGGGGRNGGGGGGQGGAQGGGGGGGGRGPQPLVLKRAK